MLPWILLTAAALAGLLVAESRGSPWGIYVCKPLASLGFLGAAVAAGAPGSLYGRTVLAALVLSWIGDVLLMSARSAVFLAGLGSFLLAHVAFGGAFLLRGEAWLWTAPGLSRRCSSRPGSSPAGSAPTCRRRCGSPSTPTSR
jgi:uncharacterized membrane protein YhhN